MATVTILSSVQYAVKTLSNKLKILFKSFKKIFKKKTTLTFTNEFNAPAKRQSEPVPPHHKTKKKRPFWGILSIQGNSRTDLRIHWRA